jgi:hypothetical protein
MRNLTISMTGSILAAGASFAQVSAEQIQAGTLTCDISGGIGFIIGSQKALNCSFVPTLPGPPSQVKTSGAAKKLPASLSPPGGSQARVTVKVPLQLPSALLNKPDAESP